MPREPDGGRLDAAVSDRDAGGASDAAAPLACDPPCPAAEVCRRGTCVPRSVDNDMDGVDAAIDCDDDDPSIGSTFERACSSMCGTGVERCMDGDWELCNAPLTCDCVDGTPPRELDCGMCGRQRQVCTGGAWVDDGACMGAGECAPGDVDMGGLCGNCGRQERHCGMDCRWGPFACVDEGECMAGAMQTDSRTCTTACGGTQTRTRTCTSMCRWGGYGPYTDCPPCGPVCGDGVCQTGETCEACADCRNGHLGNGNGGDSCAGVPDGTWRCVTITSGSLAGNQVSQVCRNDPGRCTTAPCWINFNLTPRNCDACVCGFSLSCCQTGSESTGC